MASLSDILTATGLRAYLEQRRKTAMASHDELHEAAALLQRGIENMPGRWWAGGVDQKMLARRITRPLRYAADVEEAKAKALASVWAIYSSTIGAPQPAERTARTAFDPSR